MVVFLNHTKAWTMIITTIKFKVTYKPYELVLESVSIILNKWTNDVYIRIPGAHELIDNKITIHPKTYRYIFKLRSNRKEYLRKESLLLKKLKG